MNPAELEAKLVKSAKWMFQREKSRDFWWNPGVLTHENPDKTNPGLSTDDAEEVFEELRHRQLFVNRIITNPDINEGEPFLVHQLNEEKKVEWIDTINEKGFLDLWLKPWARFFFGKSKAPAKAFVYALLLAFFVKLVQNVADNVFIAPTQIEILRTPTPSPK